MSHFDKVCDAARVSQYRERWFRFSISPPDEIRYAFQHTRLCRIVLSQNSSSFLFFKHTIQSGHRLLWPLTLPYELSLPTIEKATFRRRFFVHPLVGNRHQDIPWLPKLSLGSNSGAVGGTDGRGMQHFERFEVLGVSEGDSSDIKKVRL